MKNQRPPRNSDRRTSRGPAPTGHTPGGKPTRAGGPGKSAAGKPARASAGAPGRVYDDQARDGDRPARGKPGPRTAGAAGRGPRPPRDGAPAGERRAAPRSDRRPDRAEDYRGDERREAGPRPARAPRGEMAAEGRGEGRAEGRPTLNKHNLLYGIHAVSAAWANPARTCRSLWVTEAGLEALDQAFDTAAGRELDRPEPNLVEKEDLERMLPPGAVHQGVALDCAPLPEVAIEDIIIATSGDPQAMVVVLDQVTDPHNVGAIIRSAAAFGAKAVIVQDRHAPPLTGTLAKTASGGVEVVPLVRVTNLARAIDDLKQASFWTVGLAESGERHLHQVDLSGRSALVLGSEGDGLRRLTGERCDEIAKLPTGGPVGALNVSNAAAVALYEVARRR
ncbi:23S rRNA (guanosine(2251)-2'-O)-methyltransferase RlmB [Oleisolibacter albus]|uniref:23S rRNA (guanosine(2251)-2'-O)-methyltransferase RlmB n=1 Tax=Oleisolibacter albus TaxID=2171757 RepID=UPI000DF43F3D|nr:23S rRNA (guanosine(2251)-2'-O)-methyltransferase RlmB [Oleisolibacter albus]